jgi:hypothetical protein
MLAINPFPRPNEPCSLFHRWGHWILWTLVVLDAAFAIPIATYREYLTVAYYGQEDVVYDRVRVKIATYYQVFSNLIAMIVTYIFFMRLWSAAETTIKRAEERKRRVVRFFVNKNLVLSVLIFLGALTVSIKCVSQSFALFNHLCCCHLHPNTNFVPSV